MGAKVDTQAKCTPVLSAEDPLKAELQAALEPAVFNDICVYIAADKLLIDSLKRFVAAKLEPWLKANWNSGIFPKIVEYILLSTTAHDMVLLSVLVRIMTYRIEHMVKKKEICKLLCKFGDIGSLILTRLVDQDDIFLSWSKY